RHGKYYRNAEGEVRQCADPANAHHTKAGHLSRDKLIRHFRATDTNDIIGVYAYDADKKGKWVAIDIDAHDDQADPEANRRYAVHLYLNLGRLGFTPLLYESNGKGGFHLWALLSGPVTAAVLHRFGNWLVRDHREHGFDKPPEVFPKSAGETD